MSEMEWNSDILVLFLFFCVSRYLVLVLYYPERRAFGFAVLFYQQNNTTNSSGVYTGDRVRGILCIYRLLVFIMEFLVLRVGSSSFSSVAIPLCFIYF
jgi:hypothetical protein